jgi:hypothetical protein
LLIAEYSTIFIGRHSRISVKPGKEIERIVQKASRLRDAIATAKSFANESDNSSTAELE